MPFVQKLRDLEEEVLKLREDVATLMLSQGAIKAELNKTSGLAGVCGMRLDDAFDAIADFDRILSPAPQPKQNNQLTVLDAMLADGHWHLVQDVRKQMGLTEGAFSRLLSLTSNVDTKHSKNDKRKKLIRRKDTKQ